MHTRATTFSRTERAKVYRRAAAMPEPAIAMSTALYAAHRLDLDLATAKRLADEALSFCIACNLFDDEDARGVVLKALDSGVVPNPELVARSARHRRADRRRRWAALEQLHTLTA